MEHKNESKNPDDVKITDDSEFKKDDEVTITAGHMPSMKGAGSRKMI
ncbi:hypothetical protein [Staphylococcus sp. NAM3COL9]|nr:hypothetical protein [Staphylococcus sp. NAM3COL9]